MCTDAADTQPNIIVMEIADGILQRETKLLLNHQILRQTCRSIVLAALCAASALYGAGQLLQLGYPVLTVSGRITDSPLFMREFAHASPVPLASSAAECLELAELVVKHLPVIKSQADI